MKKKISILLSAILLISMMCVTAYADTEIGVEPGSKMPEFSAALTDGTTVSLSDLLKENDLVVLNIFASWCGPCEKEFPEMEEVYQANKDRMTILSLSGYPEDTIEIIAAYKKDHGLSFPMGLAGTDLDFMNVTNFPTTIFIDKNGNAGFVKIGAFVSGDEFEKKVNTFLAPEYDGSPLKTEKAVSLLPYLLIGFVVAKIMLVIGRWGIFRKAGKKGWHSLIPFLSSYQEFAVSWKGWIGIVAAACAASVLASGIIGLPRIAYYVFLAAEYALALIEGLKLAKVFGKGKVLGVLMALPVFKDITRLFLGLGKAQYRGAGADTQTA